MVNIQQKLTPYNFTALSNKDIRYIVVHFVGSVSSAVNNATYFANNQLKSSAHYFVDEATIWQSVLDKDMAWHCGGGLQGSGGHTFHKKCTNYNSIGIEMCCKKKSSGEWFFQESTVDNTVDLVKHLMKKYNIPIDRVIRHYDVTGKICPAPYVDEREWKKFKDRVQEETEMTEIERQKFNQMVKIVEQLSQEKERVYHYSVELPDWALPTINKLVAKGFYKGDSESDLNLPESMMRTLVVLDRAGIFDR
jgi:N-acetylmuramoyl-L-alanine amidase CwlA